MVVSQNRNAASRRILALWLPRLPADRIQRALRRTQTAQNQNSPPLVLAAKIDNALRITGLDETASRLGLRPGMPLADARAMIEPLQVQEADPIADVKLLGQIADWCDRFTPFVALDPPQGLLLDVSGATHLFGGEQALLNRLRHGLAAQGFAVQAALAGTAMAARALAHYADGALITPGAEAAAVASLPVEALGLDPLATHGLRRAGLKSIGQVASRARAELAARFGAAMLAHLDHALGRAEEPISPRRNLPDYMAERRFAEPVSTQEIIIQAIRSLSDALCDVMEERGQGARAIEAVFFRADGLVRRISVRMAKPVREPELMMRLFRERLDALADPLEAGFGFDLIRLNANETGAIRPEAIGFSDRNEDERAIDVLIDSLSARLGSECVQSFRAENTHIPEQAARAVPAQSQKPASLSWRDLESGDEIPRRPLRLFGHPEPIQVMAQIPDGPPLRFRWRKALHTVMRAEGPERIAMEWWQGNAIGPTRDYFRVENEEGCRFWLYRAGLYESETQNPVWYVHGLFS